jgi:AcrR family transcriptional regulator
VTASAAVELSRNTRHDRKTQIVATASELIRRRGYANVAMKDVAESVGVTAPALYRHFESKEALLAAAISDGLTVAEAAAQRAAGGRLGDVIGALAGAAVDERNLWVLLHRESRNLKGDNKAALSKRFARLVSWLGDRIADDYSASAPGDPELAARAVLAALSAPSQYRQTLPRRALAAALSTAALRLARSDPTHMLLSASVGAHQRPPFEPSLHRREAILQSAATLFAQRGYRAVTIDDIGASVGIAGASVYNHFTGKADILAAVLWRSVDWIESDMTRAIAEHVAAEAVLHQLYNDYADIAVRHPELFRVFTVEGMHLNATQRDRIGRAHRQFVERWIAVLRRAKPNLAAGVARADISASLCVVNDLAQLPRFRHAADGAELARLALGAVDLARPAT